MTKVVKIEILPRIVGKDKHVKLALVAPIIRSDLPNMCVFMFFVIYMIYDTYIWMHFTTSPTSCTNTSPAHYHPSHIRSQLQTHYQQALTLKGHSTQLVTRVGDQSW